MSRYILTKPHTQSCNHLGRSLESDGSSIYNDQTLLSLTLSTRQLPFSHLASDMLGLLSGFFQDVNVILAITNLKIGQQINIRERYEITSVGSRLWVTLRREIRKYREIPMMFVVTRSDVSPLLTILTPSGCHHR